MDAERIYRLAVQRTLNCPPDELVQEAKNFFGKFEAEMKGLRKHQMAGLMEWLERSPEGDPEALKKNVNEYLTKQMERDKEGTRWGKSVHGDGERLGEALENHLDTLREMAEEMKDAILKELPEGSSGLIGPSDQGAPLIEYYVLRHFLLNLGKLHRLAATEEWKQMRPLLMEESHV